MRYSRFLLVSFLVFLLCGQAGAIVFGIRYSNLNKPVLNPFESDVNKGQFGVYLGQRDKGSEYLVGIDYDRYKRERGDTLSYYRRLVLDLGFRYRLFPGERSAAMRIIPFAAIHYFKSFGKVKADTSVLSNEDKNFYNDMANDWGGWVSIGAEYAFAPAFSMGCEAGLRYSRAKSDAYGYTVKISEYRTFAAILLSFRF